MPEEPGLIIEALYEHQLHNWEMARNNYSGLSKTRTRTLSFGDFNILVQFNPERIRSSAAKVDSKSVSERPCFLCSSNRPVQQEEISYNQDFILLVNPYPVFSRHLTIPALQHIPQRIMGNFGTMLQLARDLQLYTIIYNGPNCGASAPDHMHFQAVPKGVLPVEQDYESKNHLTLWKSIRGSEISFWNNYLRNPVTLSSSDAVSLESVFGLLYKILADGLSSSEEPMMNILARYEDDRWIIHIFPRKLHRPWQYYKTGDDQLLLSPASIDMGGVIILPHEKDFNRITREDVADIYSQVCVDDAFISDLANRLEQ